LNEKHLLGQPLWCGPGAGVLLSGQQPNSEAEHLFAGLSTTRHDNTVRLVRLKHALCVRLVPQYCVHVVRPSVRVSVRPSVRPWCYYRDVYRCLYQLHVNELSATIQKNSSQKLNRRLCCKFPTKKKQNSNVLSFFEQHYFLNFQLNG